MFGNIIIRKVGVEQQIKFVRDKTLEKLWNLPNNILHCRKILHRFMLLIECWGLLIIGTGNMILLHTI